MPEVPTILHESEGLTIRRNVNNGFCVATLYYRADPAKRSEEWRREAKAGMTPEKFAREYEIDYTAVLGAKVFPEITEYKDSIVVSAPHPEFSREGKFWGGFDYGSRNPTSFHVYTLIDGCIYSIWELFKPCSNITDFVTEMKECPYWNGIRFISADPSMWAKTQQTSVGLASMHDLFWKAGIRNLVKGLNQQEDTWLAAMREHWSNPEDITFKIFDNCPNQIREFETAIYINQSEKQLLSSAYKESISDHDNHSLDDCKYFMLNLPKSQSTTAPTGQPEYMKWTIPGANKATHKFQPIPSGKRQPVGGYA